MRIPPPLSFTKAKPPTMTIDALMARQKELATRQADLSTQEYPGYGTIAGGLGNMLGKFTTAIEERRAQEQEAAGREKLAQMLSGYDPTAANAQQVAAQATQLDPDLGLKLMELGITSKQAAAAAALAATQRTEDRGWSVEDREDAQAATADAARLKADADAAKPQSTVAQINADLAANRITQEEADLAIKKATAIPQIGGTANDRKALWGEQDAYVNASSSANQLARAAELVDLGINTGYTSGLRTMAGNAGLSGEDEKGLADRTKEYNSIMNQEAIGAMSQALKGATTDTEMAEFIKNMNDPTLDPKVKARQINTMLAKVEAHQRLQGQRIQDLGGEVPRVDAFKPQNAPPEITSQQEFDALPSGSVYIEDGKQYRKP